MKIVSFKQVNELHKKVSICVLDANTKDALHAQTIG